MPVKSQDAIALLYPFIQRVFKTKIDIFSKMPVNTTLEVEANAALRLLSENLFMSIEGFPLDVQRLMYEKIIMVITVFIASPAMVLDSEFDKCKTDAEKLSLLLRGEVVSMNLRALTTH